MLAYTRVITIWCLVSIQSHIIQYNTANLGAISIFYHQVIAAAHILTPDCPKVQVIQFLSWNNRVESGVGNFMIYFMFCGMRDWVNIIRLESQSCQIFFTADLRLSTDISLTSVAMNVSAMNLTLPSHVETGVETRVSVFVSQQRESIS